MRRRTIAPFDFCSHVFAPPSRNLDPKSSRQAGQRQGKSSPAFITLSSPGGDCPMKLRIALLAAAVASLLGFTGSVPALQAQNAVHFYAHHPLWVVSGPYMD